MKTIYLCGPINGCADAECMDWREFVKARWEGGALDPMRRDYRGREAESVNEIVTLDKVDIANSDAILVNYDRPSVGTSMEVYLAFTAGKLVVVVAKDGERISPWLRYHSHKITNNFNAALVFIRENLQSCS
jgi:nucleoside 2-deoxyribosyltransferase